MIGVDTNVIVRLLTADAPGQYGAALSFFRDRTTSDPAYVSAITLAETVWVLRRTYGFSAAEITNSVRMILDSDDFVVEESAALRFIQDQAASPALIADYLIAHLGKVAGCRSTVTFDKRAAKAVPGMELLA